MSETISIDAAGGSLVDIISRLPLGGTITLVGREGTSLALLVSLKSVPAVCQAESSEIDARLDSLADRISRAWTGRRNASAVLSEARI